MSEQLRVVVVDDEPIALEGMSRLVSVDAELVVVAECCDGASAVDAIRSSAPDLVLLDVQMPGLDGFGVIRDIGVANMPTVVFVTAFDTYAIDAFQVHAVDYVLKPFSDDRFREALSHAKGLVRHRTVRALSSKLLDLLNAVPAAARTPQIPSSLSVDSVPSDGWARRVAVRHDGSQVYINVADIEWIEGADYYARLHSKKRSFLIRESLAALAGRLDPSQFFRTHRSAIVNLDHVRVMQPMFQGEAVAILGSGARVRIARNRRAELEQALEGGNRGAKIDR